jgi:hypothetical protein
MLIAFLILVGMIVLILFIPLGAEIASEDGIRQYRLIIAGIRMKFTPKTRSEITDESEAPAAESSPSDIVERLGTLRDSSVRIWEFYDGKLPGKLWITLKRYYRALHFRVHRCELRIGFPDPAATGAIYGAACALAAAFSDRIPLRLTPDFVNGRSGFDYRISLTFIPARILFETIRTIISLRLWVILRSMRGTGSPAMQTRRQHG